MVRPTSKENPTYCVVEQVNGKFRTVPNGYSTPANLQTLPPRSEKPTSSTAGSSTINLEHDYTLSNSLEDLDEWSGAVQDVLVETSNPQETTAKRRRRKGTGVKKVLARGNTPEQRAKNRITNAKRWATQIATAEKAGACLEYIEHMRERARICDEKAERENARLEEEERLAEAIENDEPAPVPPLDSITTAEEQRVLAKVFPNYTVPQRNSEIMDKENSALAYTDSVEMGVEPYQQVPATRSQGSSGMGAQRIEAEPQPLPEVYRSDYDRGRVTRTNPRANQSQKSHLSEKIPLSSTVSNDQQSKSFTGTIPQTVHPLLQNNILQVEPNRTILGNIDRPLATLGNVARTQNPVAPWRSYTAPQRNSREANPENRNVPIYTPVEMDVEPFQPVPATVSRFQDPGQHIEPKAPILENGRGLTGTTEAPMKLQPQSGRLVEPLSSTVLSTQPSTDTMKAPRRENFSSILQNNARLMEQNRKPLVNFNRPFKVTANVVPISNTEIPTDPPVAESQMSTNTMQMQPVNMQQTGLRFLENIVQKLHNSQQQSSMPVTEAPTLPLARQGCKLGNLQDPTLQVESKPDVREELNNLEPKPVLNTGTSLTSRVAPPVVGASQMLPSIASSIEATASEAQESSTEVQASSSVQEPPLQVDQSPPSSSDLSGQPSKLMTRQLAPGSTSQLSPIYQANGTSSDSFGPPSYPPSQFPGFPGQPMPHGYPNQFGFPMTQPPFPIWNQAPPMFMPPSQNMWSGPVMQQLPDGSFQVFYPGPVGTGAQMQGAPQMPQGFPFFPPPHGFNMTMQPGPSFKFSVSPNQSGPAIRPDFAQAPSQLSGQARSMNLPEQNQPQIVNQTGAASSHSRETEVQGPPTIPAVCRTPTAQNPSVSVAPGTGSALQNALTTFSAGNSSIQSGVDRNVNTTAAQSLVESQLLESYLTAASRPEAETTSSDEPSRDDDIQIIEPEPSEAELFRDITTRLKMLDPLGRNKQSVASRRPSEGKTVDVSGNFSKAGQEPLRRADSMATEDSPMALKGQILADLVSPDSSQLFNSLVTTTKKSASSLLFTKYALKGNPFLSSSHVSLKSYYPASAKQSKSLFPALDSSKVAESAGFSRAIATSQDRPSVPVSVPDVQVTTPRAPVKRSHSPEKKSYNPKKRWKIMHDMEAREKAEQDLNKAGSAPSPPSSETSGHRTVYTATFSPDLSPSLGESVSSVSPPSDLSTLFRNSFTKSELTGSVQQGDSGSLYKGIQLNWSFDSASKNTEPISFLSSLKPKDSRENSNTFPVMAPKQEEVPPVPLLPKIVARTSYNPIRPPPTIPSPTKNDVLPGGAPSAMIPELLPQLAPSASYSTMSARVTRKLEQRKKDVMEKSADQNPHNSIFEHVGQMSVLNEEDMTRTVLQIVKDIVQESNDLKQKMGQSTSVQKIFPIGPVMCQVPPHTMISLPVHPDRKEALFGSRMDQTQTVEGKKMQLNSPGISQQRGSSLNAGQAVNPIRPPPPPNVDKAPVNSSKTLIQETLPPIRPVLVQRPTPEENMKLTCQGNVLQAPDHQDIEKTPVIFDVPFPEIRRNIPLAKIEHLQKRRCPKNKAAAEEVTDALVDTKILEILKDYNSKMRDAVATLKANQAAVQGTVSQQLRQALQKEFAVPIRPPLPPDAHESMLRRALLAPIHRLQSPAPPVFVNGNLVPHARYLDIRPQLVQKPTVVQVETVVTSDSMVSVKLSDKDKETVKEIVAPEDRVKVKRPSNMEDIRPQPVQKITAVQDKTTVPKLPPGNRQLPVKISNKDKETMGNTVAPIDPIKEKGSSKMERLKALLPASMKKVFKELQRGSGQKKEEYKAMLNGTGLVGGSETTVNAVAAKKAVKDKDKFDVAARSSKKIKDTDLQLRSKVIKMIVGMKDKKKEEDSQESKRVPVSKAAELLRMEKKIQKTELVPKHLSKTVKTSSALVHKLTFSDQIKEKSMALVSSYKCLQNAGPTLTLILLGKEMVFKTEFVKQRLLQFAQMSMTYKLNSKHKVLQVHAPALKPSSLLAIEAPKLPVVTVNESLRNLRARNSINVLIPKEDSRPTPLPPIRPGFDAQASQVVAECLKTGKTMKSYVGVTTKRQKSAQEELKKWKPIGPEKIADDWFTFPVVAPHPAHIVSDLDLTHVVTLHPDGSQHYIHTANLAKEVEFRRQIYGVNQTDFATCIVKKNQACYSMLLHKDLKPFERLRSREPYEQMLRWLQLPERMRLECLGLQPGPGICPPPPAKPQTEVKVLKDQPKVVVQPLVPEERVESVEKPKNNKKPFLLHIVSRLVRNPPTQLKQMPLKQRAKFVAKALGVDYKRFKQMIMKELTARDAEHKTREC